jgi:hypothetical protein
MPNTVTIVFRGLMVFNHQRDYMEIGFIDGLPHPSQAAHHGPAQSALPAGAHAHPVHIPRILTMKDGILASVLDLRTREDELKNIRNWTIEVTLPSQPSATVMTVGTDFDRQSNPPPNPRDFRWIIDLEARDLHNRNLSRELDTRRFLLVLYVRHGEFYTRMKSPYLRRGRADGSSPEVPYGCIAAVTGCDIKFEDGGEVKLMAGGSEGSEVFKFRPDANTIYEFSNAPPDVPTAEPYSPDEGGHFHMYYDKLFIQAPQDQFHLEESDLAPSPNPTICGAAFLGRRGDPL